eukprot:15352749-Ditylum_brightwellii.AAC.1
MPYANQSFGKQILPTKHPKSEEVILKSNPTPRQRNFRPSLQQHKNPRYKNNRVNEIEDEQDNENETQDDEKFISKTQHNEDLCLINANEYEEESDDEEYTQNISNLNINIQESHGIGAETENTSPNNDVYNIAQCCFNDMSMPDDKSTCDKIYDTQDTQ